MMSTTSARPQEHLACAEEVENEEDLISSTPNIWQPIGVVKKHRRTATLIWVMMLVAFLVYIIYMALDLIEARKNPSASIKIQQDYYTYPDISFCVTRGEGCYEDGEVCFDPKIVGIRVTSQTGFMENDDELEALEEDERSQEIQSHYPACRVLPLSKLTVNETGVEDGDIDYFDVALFILWYENPTGTPDVSINSQFVQMYFIDVEADTDVIGEEIVDGKIPYDVILPVDGEEFTTMHSHVMLSMTEYTPIGRSGQGLETERTYTQRTTTGTSVWAWSGNSTDDLEFAFLVMNILIPKFEYTVIEDIDPVDAWAIIGAIGGVWQIVCVAFGLFFVFSVKQLPDKKLRNFKKAAMKPAVVIAKRLSFTSSKHAQDEQIDASDEDLPDDWVKKRRADGSVYYLNTLTGHCQDLPPNGLGAPPAASAGLQPALRQGGAVHPPGRGVSSGQRGHGRSSPGSLPPGWLARADENGDTYYVNTISRTSQWERPSLLAPAVGQGAPPQRGGVAMVDIPMVHHHPRGGSGPNPGRRAIEMLPPPPPPARGPVPDGGPRSSHGDAGSRGRDNHRPLPAGDATHPGRRAHSRTQPASDDDVAMAIPAPSQGSGARARGSGSRSTGRPSPSTSAASDSDAGVSAVLAPGAGAGGLSRPKPKKAKKKAVRQMV